VDEGGVDQTLLWEMARMTPEQRLEHHDRILADLLELRRALSPQP